MKISDDDTFSIGKVEGLGRDELFRLLLKFLDLFRRHEVCIVVFKDGDVSVNLAFSVVVVADAYVDLGTKTLLSFIIEALGLVLRLREDFLEPYTELTEVCLILTVELEFLGVC